MGDGDPFKRCTLLSAQIIFSQLVTEFLASVKAWQNWNVPTRFNDNIVLADNGTGWWSYSKICRQWMNAIHFQLFPSGGHIPHVVQSSNAFEFISTIILTPAWNIDRMHTLQSFRHTQIMTKDLNQLIGVGECLFLRHNTTVADFNAP